MDFYLRRGYWSEAQDASRSVQVEEKIGRMGQAREVVYVKSSHAPRSVATVDEKSTFCGRKFSTLNFLNRPPLASDAVEMLSNVEKADRAVLFLVGLALFTLPLMHVVTGGWPIGSYAIGAIALMTGVVRFCPAWLLFKIDACSAITS